MFSKGQGPGVSGTGTWGTVGEKASNIQERLSKSFIRQCFSVIMDGLYAQQSGKLLSKGNEQCQAILVGSFKTLNPQTEGGPNASGPYALMGKV